MGSSPSYFKDQGVVQRRTEDQLYEKNRRLGHSFRTSTPRLRILSSHDHALAATPNMLHEERFVRRPNSRRQLEKFLCLLASLVSGHPSNEFRNRVRRDGDLAVCEN